MEGVAGASGVECPVAYGGRGPVVLLLHGYSFRGATWVELGYTRLLEELGYTFVAPDMPYGRGTGCNTRTMSVDVNLGIIQDSLRLVGAERAVLAVAASLGARYAVYAASAGLVDSLLLAAPALGRDDRAWALLKGLRSRRSLVVWGSGDSVVSRGAVEEVSRRLGAPLLVVRGAGHVVYRDDPHSFTVGLLGMLSCITSESLCRLVQRPSRQQR